jgi:hypothetical protein
MGIRSLARPSWAQRRNDLLTASRIDFGLTLLPVVGRQNVARMLAHHKVPVGLVLRVLASPNRRAIAEE